MKLLSLFISLLVLVGCSITSNPTAAPNTPDIRKTAEFELQGISTQVADRVDVELTAQSPTFTPIPTDTPIPTPTPTRTPIPTRTPTPTPTLTPTDADTDADADADANHNPNTDAGPVLGSGIHQAQRYRGHPGVDQFRDGRNRNDRVHFVFLHGPYRPGFTRNRMEALLQRQERWWNIGNPGVRRVRARPNGDRKSSIQRCCA